MEFNINDVVEVILTKEGAEVYNTYYELMQLPEKYKPARLAEGDVLQDQLWGVMQIFGPHICVTGMPPFKDCKIKLLCGAY